jgi:cardiolipin synthase (CMP-forming)
MKRLFETSFMTNETVRLYFHDRIMAQTFVPLIPKFVKPNHITVLRFFLIPFNIYFLWIENWHILIPLFLLTGFTDVLDGSLARLRKQITLWGTIADPAADKILMGSVATIFIVREVDYLLAFTLVLLELLIILGAWSRKSRGEYISANWTGKIKMALQVTGIALLFIGKMTGSPIAFVSGTVIVVVSLAFAVMSLISYGL